MDVLEIEKERDGILSYAIRKDGTRPWWWYLDLNNRPLVLVGNVCGTCNAIFKLVGNAKLPLTPRQLSDQFEDGLSIITNEIVETVLELLPQGKYQIALQTISPKLMLGKDRTLYTPCESEYYWLCDYQKDGFGVKYEIVLPIVNLSGIDEARTEYYRNKIEQRILPTALSFTINDYRSPAGKYSEEVKAHFLLDGHHKMIAASQASRSITMLSFCRLNPFSETYQMLLRQN